MARDAPRPIDGYELARRRRRRRAGTYVGLLIALILAQVMWFVPGLDLPDTLGFEAVLLAVAAVVFAVQHSTELEYLAEELGGLALSAGQHATELHTVTDVLHSVLASVPTRGVGVFPFYMDEVAELVGRTKRSLRIMCDTPTHGVFSNTTAFEEYWRNLGHLRADGIKITCAFLNAKSRRLMHRAQIREDETDWAEWQERNRSNCEAFQRFALDMRVSPPIDPGQEGDPVRAWGATPDAYVESMMRINEAVTAEFGHRMVVDWLDPPNPLREGPSVYFWLRDETQEAVFVFVPVQGVGVRDFAGFHTREPELIQALYNVFDHRGPTGGP